MCRKSVVWALSVLMLGLSINISDALGQDGLIGYWKFDETAGTTAADSVGGDNDGTLENAVQFQPGAGRKGGAVLYDSEENTGRVGIPTTGMSNSEGTVMVWGKLAEPYPTNRDDASYFFGHTQQGSYADRLQLYMNAADTILDLGLGDTHTRRTDILNLQTEVWYHVALTWDSGNYVVYVNGEEADSGTYTGLTAIYEFMDIGNDGNHQSGGAEAFAGLLDEARIFNRALGADEIRAAMAAAPYPFASGPTPKDGAIYFDTWVTLSWRSGDLAVSHDIYLGADFDNVNDATRDSDVYQGNQTTNFFVAGFPGFAYPEGLVPGTTYYWRIDEVNEANPDSPWKGDVWSFSIPPKTAYNPDPADGAEVADASAVTLTWTAGFGAKLHTMYFGDDYGTVANATTGIPAGTTRYNPGPLEVEKVYYWRVDEFDGLGTYKGDVWAFTTPGAVGDPKPANGAEDVTMATVLSWTSADNAVSHEVYLGLDKEVVRSADTTSPEYKGPKALGAESYDAGLLEPDTAYYWRVDEVYTGNTVKGPVWSFAVGPYLLVDDFESYTDDDPNNEAIWQHWIDGFGVADNGAQVGYLMPPYAEQTIVHGGTQSMPLFYVNEAGVTNSEATLTLSTLRDFTTAGVADLSLWVRGGSANAAEPMYVALSNSAGAPAIVAHDDPAAATVSLWNEWRIGLQAFADQGINLTNVDKIVIGLGSKSGTAGAGGSGTVFVDDIRLYQP